MECGGRLGAGMVCVHVLDEVRVCMCMCMMRCLMACGFQSWCIVMCFVTRGCCDVFCDRQCCIGSSLSSTGWTYVLHGDRTINHIDPEPAQCRWNDGAGCKD